MSVPRPGLPTYDEAALDHCQVTGVQRLIRLDLQLTLETLEAWLSVEASEPYLTLLRERCARLNQLYSALHRRLGSVLAWHFFDWELRLLRYRASSLLTPLVFGPVPLPTAPEDGQGAPLP